MSDTGTYMTADRAYSVNIDSGGEIVDFRVHDIKDKDDPATGEGHFLDRRYRLQFRVVDYELKSRDLLWLIPVRNAGDPDADAYSDAHAPVKFNLLHNMQGKGNEGLRIQVWDHKDHKKGGELWLYRTKAPMVKYAFYGGFLFWTLMAALMTAILM